MHSNNVTLIDYMREVAAVVEAMVEQVRRIPGEPFRHSLAAWGMGEKINQ